MRYFFWYYQYFFKISDYSPYTIANFRNKNRKSKNKFNHQYISKPKLMRSKWR